MRITHVISGLNPLLGGTAVAVAELARAQRAAGLDVSVVSSFLGEATVVASSLRDIGVDVIEIGPCRRPLNTHPDLAAALQRAIGSTDMVHIHALWEEIQHRAAVISRKLGKPYVFTSHGMLDPWSLSQSKWRKRVYLALRMGKDLNRATAIHYTSDLERDGAAPLGLKPPGIVEPNGVDLREFENLPARGTFRSRYAQIGGRPMALFLSRVHPKKGLDLLIPAFARGAPGDAVLVIAGPGEESYIGEVRDAAKRQNIGDRVIFTGMLRGGARIEPMVDADLFVLPSYQENFGIVVAEALAAGCAVLISDKVNIHPDITAGQVGQVVPTQVIPLADALRRWLSDAGLRMAAGARGPAFVRQRYDWSEIARRWIGHYTALRGRS